MGALPTPQQEAQPEPKGPLSRAANHTPQIDVAPGNEFDVQPGNELLNTRELRRIPHRFITGLGENIGPYTDIPAPDLYTNEQTMAWVYNAFHPEHNNFPFVTGKPLGIGGSAGRAEATGRGYLTMCRKQDVSATQAMTLVFEGDLHEFAL